MEAHLRRQLLRQGAPLVCAVTGRHLTGGRDLVAHVAGLVAGGVRAVQLREKDLGARDMLALALALRPVTDHGGALLLVNDRLDVALAAGADGVHLPQAGLPPVAARTVAGPDCLVGVSVHDPSEAQAALAAGADYLIFGHVCATDSKAGAAPRGMAALREVVEAADRAPGGPVPVWAIGGMERATAPAALRAGACGVAVLSGAMAASDPTSYAASLVAALREGR